MKKTVDQLTKENKVLKSKPTQSQNRVEQLISNTPETNHLPMPKTLCEGFPTIHGKIDREAGKQAELNDVLYRLGGQINALVPVQQNIGGQTPVKDPPANIYDKLSALSEMTEGNLNIAKNLLDEVARYI